MRARNESHCTSFDLKFIEEGERGINTRIEQLSRAIGRHFNTLPVEYRIARLKRAKQAIKDGVSLDAIYATINHHIDL